MTKRSLLCWLSIANMAQRVFWEWKMYTCLVREFSPPYMHHIKSLRTLKDTYWLSQIISDWLFSELWLLYEEDGIASHCHLIEQPSPYSRQYHSNNALLPALNSRDLMHALANLSKIFPKLTIKIDRYQLSYFPVAYFRCSFGQTAEISL